MYAEKVQAWAETELRRTEREEKFWLRRFGIELEQWVIQELEKQNGKRKSINLPAGVVGFRT